MMPKCGGKAGGACVNFRARWSLVLLLFFGAFVSYSARTNLTLTMVAMVNHTAILEEAMGQNGRNSTQNMADGQCPLSNNNTGNETETADGPFVWNMKIQGFVQGGFFYGYASTQIIAGRMSERYGPKYLIGGGFALASVLSFFSPLLANLGPYYLMTARVVSGMALGVFFPGVNRLFTLWIPPNERGRLYTIVMTGANTGVLISMSLIGWLCNHGFAGGWPSVFYLTGCVGLIWTLFWLTLAHDTPLEHPRISLEERQYILDSLPPVKARMPVPWKSILTSVPLLAFVWTITCSTWVFYTRVTELPTYLDSVLHIPIQENGLLNSMVTLSAILFAGGSAILADYLIEKNIFSRTKVRKICEVIGQMGMALCLLGVTFSGCNGTLVIALLTLGSGLLSFCGVGSAIIAMDIAPAFSGTVFGIANTINSVTGFMTPLVTGIIVTGRDPFTEWHTVFYVSVGVAIMGSSVFVAFSSAEPQPWNEVADEVESDKESIIERKSSGASRESFRMRDKF